MFLSIPLAVIGFKKKNKVLATLSFFLIVVSFSLAYKAKEAKAGPKTVALNGKEIYKEKCTLCHGDNGKLGMNGAKDLSVTQLQHAGILEILAEDAGRAPKPGDAFAEYFGLDDFVLDFLPERHHTSRRLCLRLAHSRQVHFSK